MPADPLLNSPASHGLGVDPKCEGADDASGPPDLDPLHYLNLGKGGRLSGGGFYSSTPETVKGQVAVLATGTDVFLYLHGGLNGERQAGADAKLILDWQAATLKMPSVCVIWETRPWILRVFDNLGENDDKKETEGGLRLPKKLKKQAFVCEQTLRTHLHVPAEEAIPLKAVAALWKGEPPPRVQFGDEDLDGEGESGVRETDGGGGLSPELRAVFRSVARRQEVFGKSRARAWEALIQTVWRVYAGLHHGLWATVLEEVLRVSRLRRLAAKAWKEMMDKAAGAYQENPPQDDPDEPYGGSYFLDALNAGRAGVGGPPLRLHVWGQSAGAVHAAHLVSHVAEHCDHLRVETLILTNAGVRFDVFDGLVVPHLPAIGRVVMLGLGTQTEAEDTLCTKDPEGYPSSLLTMVSGLLEDEADAALMGLQRMYDGESARSSEDPVTEVITALTAMGPARFVQAWSPSGGLTFASHGGPCGPIEDDSVRSLLVQLLSLSVQGDGPLS